MARNSDDVRRIAAAALSAVLMVSASPVSASPLPFLAVSAAPLFASSAVGQEQGEFVVERAWFSAAGPGRFLHADMHVPESGPLRQTLESGLEVDFLLHVSVLRRRWWWLDQRSADIVWRATLSYDPILRRYKLATADGFRRAYPKLRDALDRLGKLRQWPASPDIAPALDNPDSYLLARLEVDIARLPQPVKILLLTDDDWDFDSGWTRLPLRIIRADDNSEERAADDSESYEAPETSAESESDSAPAQ